MVQTLALSSTQSQTRTPRRPPHPTISTSCDCGPYFHTREKRAHTPERLSAASRSRHTLRACTVGNWTMCSYRLLNSSAGANAGSVAASQTLKRGTRQPPCTCGRTRALLHMRVSQINAVAIGEAPQSARAWPPIPRTTEAAPPQAALQRANTTVSQSVITLPYCIDRSWH